jgi:hypothetical protein
MINLPKIKSSLREINDPICGDENPAHKIFRYIIRFGMYTRILNFNISQNLIKILSKNFNEEVNDLIIKNIFYIRYINNIRKNNVEMAIREKYRWAEYIIDNKKNENINAINTAKEYINFINNYFLNIPSDIFKKFKKIKKINNEQIYYLYGPNSEFPPNTKFKNEIIIFTKFPNCDVTEFNRKIIFLNNYVLLSIEIDEIKKLTKDYSMVFIPKGSKCFSDNVYEMPEINANNLAAPMGLGRIILTLRNVLNAKNLILEGFDLGLAKNGYSGNIITGFDLQDNIKFEKNYSRSLVMHDFIYNFLLIKFNLNNLNVVGDENFLNILNMDLDSYISKITKIRDFSKI